MLRGIFSFFRIFLLFGVGVGVDVGVKSIVVGIGVEVGVKSPGFGVLVVPSSSLRVRRLNG